MKLRLFLVVTMSLLGVLAGLAGAFYVLEHWIKPEQAARFAAESSEN